MKYKSLMILIISAFFVTACNKEGTNNSLDDQQPQRLSTNEQIENNRDHTNQEAAERIAKLATNVPNVNKATAIVFGNYTIVGIDVDADLDRTKVGSIKYSVAEAIKHDPYGHYAFVIADGDIIERLNRMGQLIRDGHPDDAILDELANLVGRYMPELPARDNQPKQNNQQQTDEQMENIQEEQSNNNMNKQNNNRNRNDNNQDKSL